MLRPCRRRHASDSLLRSSGALGFRVMSDDEQGLREPAATSGDTRHEASKSSRGGARGGGRHRDDGRAPGGMRAGGSADDATPPGARRKKKKQGSFWKELPIL